jgi:small subunit ribosomal protein S6|tara:strand:+ start:1176 stop:1745 length:570 start_codon:yes stop_codon:yes gene_type:complete
VEVLTQGVVMRHYEIVFLVHPDQSDQTNTIISKLSSVVSESGGTVHRSENIGNRKLAYPIQDQFKASYGLLNIECDQATIDEIKTSFKFNDSIIRNLILNAKKTHTETSALLNQTKEDSEKESYEQEKQRKYEEEKTAKAAQQARFKEEREAKAEKAEVAEVAEEKTEEEKSSENVKDESQSSPEDTEK